jgi:hypothetical protein
MRRHAALAFLAMACIATPLAARDNALDPVDHALRRAALELGAGRPAVAAEVLARLDIDPRTDKRAALALLLRCEARLLSGDATARAGAGADLERLATVDDEFVRAQAAAHRLVLEVENVAVAQESITTAATAADSAFAALSPRVQAALANWQHERGGLDRDAASFVHVAAAWLYTQRGDAGAARRALEAADRNPGALAARLQQGEAALAGHDAAAARKQFEALGKASRDDTWMAAWARFGTARARVQAGDSSGAREALAAVTSPEPLASYARLLSGQWAYAQGDRDAAARALSGLNLEEWNPVLATEADLLALQAALDSDDFAAAESLGTRVERQLESRTRLEIDTGPLCRDLILDLGAWHAAATRGTLDELASKTSCGTCRIQPCWRRRRPCCCSIRTPPRRVTGSRAARAFVRA